MTYKSEDLFEAVRDMRKAQKKFENRRMDWEKKEEAESLVDKILTEGIGKP